MGALYLTATLLGRPNSGIVSLLVAGGGDGRAAADVVRDVSFQLSFAATAGLVVLVPLMRERLDEASAASPGCRTAARVPGPSSRSPVVTAAASSATLPLIALHFQRMSLVALPANLLVLPAFPFILLSSTLVAQCRDSCREPLAARAGWFAWLGLSYMIATVRLLADVPFASLELRRFNMEMCAASMLLAALCWLVSRRRPGGEALRRLLATPRAHPRRAGATPARRPRRLAGDGTGAAALVTWMAVLASPDSRLCRASSPRRTAG